MVMLSPKENYLRIVRGEMPDYVPIYTMMGPGHNGEQPTAMCGHNIFNTTHFSPGGGRDMWGVKYVPAEEANGASLPEPNNFMLKNIRDWRDVVKNPEVPSGLDWDKIAEDALAMGKIDREQTAVMLPCDFSPFQQLMAFMGFNEGLCAMYEEPEEVEALYDYITEFLLPITEKALDAYKPDIFYILDDSAAKLNPFISVEMYQKLLKPVYKRFAKLANDRGIPIQFHNCGRFEDFMDDMVDFGVRITDPVQRTNDLDAMKENYKGRVALAGCWEFDIPESWPIVDEEEIRQSVRDVIDQYAPGGGYAFLGGVLGHLGDKKVEQINNWIAEEAYVYGRDFYNK